MVVWSIIPYYDYTILHSKAEIFFIFYHFIIKVDFFNGSSKSPQLCAKMLPIKNGDNLVPYCEGKIIEWGL